MISGISPVRNWLAASKYTVKDRSVKKEVKVLYTSTASGVLNTVADRSPR